MNNQPPVVDNVAIIMIICKLNIYLSKLDNLSLVPECIFSNYIYNIIHRSKNNVPA